ncbi:ATP-grasp fold amidoligase family protein [Kaistia geumhonensis]|uniref:Glycosyltransferase n=1 Tax=Kaistia geumhonensis TaxID=410839 RepID=A0ABU0MD23_9HYPH|nr:ATP-grasp fold amidoligase family protein [Kaistia geumhonensis]MCX5481616.1 ATP-grasp fold amidoligase family protein [Kaistia geumhonensis]MDQ0518683.1 hypothetical protein [Kaistia geumhonensis]
MYRDHCGREPSILSPRRFTEKLQWRKLFDLDPHFAVFCDKYESHRYVAERLGPGMQAEVYFVGDDPEAVPLESLPRPFVLKSTHACEHVAVVKSGDVIDGLALRAKMRDWLAVNHGSKMMEPGYENVRRRLIVESFLGDPDGEPFQERKIFCFDGKARFIESVAVSGPQRLRQTQFHDVDWTRLYWKTLREPFPGVMLRPSRLDDMIATAERLAAGFDFLRIDLYDGGDRFWVGEVTPYSWSGLVNFTPDEADYVLGAAWHLRAKLFRAALAILFRRRRILPPKPAGVPAAAAPAAASTAVVAN